MCWGNTLGSICCVVCSKHPDVSCWLWNGQLLLQIGVDEHMIVVMKYSSGYVIWLDIGYIRIFFFIDCSSNRWCVAHIGFVYFSIAENAHEIHNCWRLVMDLFMFDIIGPVELALHNSGNGQVEHGPEQGDLSMKSTTGMGSFLFL